MRRRGPAKGYTGALEHRLQEVEGAFLQLLSVVDEGTVESAFSNWETEIQRQASPLPTDGLKTNNSNLISLWGKYPLNTAEDVKKWADARRRAPTKSPEEVEGEMEPGCLDTSEPRKSVSDLTLENERAMITSVDTDSLGQREIHFPKEFREQFLW